MFPAFLAIVTIYIIFTKITDLYPIIGFNTPWSLSCSTWAARWA